MLTSFETSSKDVRNEIDGESLNKLIGAVEPQFRLSEPRRLLVGWSEDVAAQLRRRFLLRGKQSSGLTEHEHDAQLRTRLKDLVSRIVPGAEENFVEGLKPDQLFGEQFARTLRSVKPITRAVVGRTRAVLIDGVDTTVGDSTEVIRRANRIAFTFWQYGEASHNPSLPPSRERELVRVGIVFDGQPKTKILRDYSLHQFNKDADFAVEADGPENLSIVKEEIEKTLRDITTCL